MNVTVSGIVGEKGNRKIYVVFSKEGEKGAPAKTAEGSLPEAKIIRNEGFEPWEVEQLEAYLKEHEDDIVAQAKQINVFKALMK